MKEAFFQAVFFVNESMLKSETKGILQVIDFLLISLDSANRFAQVPDFDGKAEVKKDLEDRATRQLKIITERDEGELIRGSLASALARTIADCSEALYRLEKRMLDRFPREREYVKSFFLDAASKQKLKSKPETLPKA